MIKTKKGRRAAAYFLILCLCVCQVVNYGAYTAHAASIKYLSVVSEDFDRAYEYCGSDDYYYVKYYTTKIYYWNGEKENPCYNSSFICLPKTTERICLYIGNFYDVMILSNSVGYEYKAWTDICWLAEANRFESSNGYMGFSHAEQDGITELNHYTLDAEYADVPAFNFYAYSDKKEYDVNMVYSDVPIFNSKDAAVAYIREGTINNGACIYNPEVFEYSEDICLDEFKMELHSSCTADLYFIRFYYKPSDYMLEHKGNIDLYVSWLYEASFLNANLDGITGPMGGIGIDFDISKFDFRDYHIELPLSPPNGNYIDLYVWDDIIDPALTSAILNGELLEDKKICEILVTGGDVGILGLLVNMSQSVLDMTIKCSVKGVQGKYYTAYADLLNPNNSYTSFSEPSKDDNGNVTDDYKIVADSITKIGGYYYTDVSQDNYGNNTYNYYYINEKGLSEEISSDASGNPVTNNDLNIKLDADIDGKFDVNLNVNQGTSSDNSTGGIDIDIADDDYTDGTLVDNIKNLYGLRDDLETAEEDDGALMFLEHLLSALPGDIGGMLGYGCSSVVVVAILRALLKR